MDVIVRPHLLSERERTVLELPAGMTLAEIVAAYPWPAGVEDYAVILLDKQVVPREWWARIRPREGARVDLTIGMRGGKMSNEQILLLFASIAISAIAPAAGVAIVGQAGVAANVVAAGIAIVGNLALAALFKPPEQTMPSGEQPSKAYRFNGQSNSFRPYGVLPRVLGVHRVYPDVVGTPYTEVGGQHAADGELPDDQYMRALYSFGYGGVVIDDIRIGENPISQYGPQLNPLPDFKRGDKLKYFASDVAVDGYAIALVQNVPTTVRSRALTDSVLIDIQYPRGLGRAVTTTLGNVSINTLTSVVRVEYRDVALGSGAPWHVAADADWSVSDGALGGVYQGRMNPVLSVQGMLVFPVGSRDFSVSNWPVQASAGGWILLRDQRLIIESSTATTVRTTTGLTAPISEPSLQNNGTLPFSYGTSTASDWTISTRGQVEPFIASITLAFPTAGQWDIRFTQLDAPQSSATAWNERTLTAVRSFWLTKAPVVPDVWPDPDPLKPPGSLIYQTVALLEVRIKATDQLSGVIDNINAVVATKVQKWTGSAWVAATVAEYSNPAWIYLELLMGPANHRPVKEARIDLAQFKRWADFCDSPIPGKTGPRATCNFVVDRPFTLWQLLSSVAAAGRAMPTMRDNKYSVIFDEDNKPEVQIFSPRNSWGLSATRKYLAIPNALRVKWIDPSVGYLEAVAPVYDDGFDVNNAKTYEDLELFGCTSFDQAIRDGRTWLARAKLQQEEFSLSTDIENIVCTRGDLIGIAHDVMQVGGWSARIAAMSGNDVQFDSELKAFATPWALRWRTAAGVISGPLPFIAKAGAPGWYTVTGKPAAGAVDDLVLYGTSGVEQGRYLVKAVRPGDDLTAVIDCIEYAPGIYAADTGTIPAYVPQGQSPTSLLPGPVLSLAATVASWTGGDRHQHASVTLFWSTPASTIPPSTYIIKRVNTDGTTNEIGRTASMSFVALPDADTTTAIYSGATVTYEVVAQWPGIAGPGSRVSALLPAGTITALPALTGLTATPEPRRVFVQWTASAFDVAFYVIRYGVAGSTWASTAATEQKIKANQIDLPAGNFPSGDWLVFVLQEDAAGQRGASISAPFTVLPPRAVNIVGTAVQNTVFLRWGSLSGIPAGDWTAQTTFQVEYYEVTKTKLAGLSADMRRLPNGLGTLPAELVTAQDLAQQRAEARADPPVDLGRYAGEFAVLSEQQVGNWHYCMRGVDVAGNLAPQACIDLAVFAPSNYLLLDTLANILNEPECTHVNAVQNPDLTWLAPVNETETWAQHYTSHAWVKPADQIAAGFPVYAQPPGTTKGTFSWTHDYGAALPSLRLTAAAYYSGIGGTPLVTLILFSKINAGDAWTELARTATSVTALLPPTTRYIRIDTEVLSDSPTNAALANIDRVQFILDVQFKDDAGTVTTATGTGLATVVFNVAFLDVRSVQLTSNDPGIAYAFYTLAPDDQSMTVQSFDKTGVAKGGNVAWTARGI